MFLSPSSLFYGFFMKSLVHVVQIGVFRRFKVFLRVAPALQFRQRLNPCVQPRIDEKDCVHLFWRGFQEPWYVPLAVTAFDAALRALVFLARFHEFMVFSGSAEVYSTECFIFVRHSSLAVRAQHFPQAPFVLAYPGDAAFLGRCLCRI